MSQFVGAKETPGEEGVECKDADKNYSDKYSLHVDKDENKQQLSVTVTDKQTGKVFEGLYPMQQLIDIGFSKQMSFDAISDMLISALDGNDTSIDLTISFIDNNNNDAMRDSYRRGDSMIWTLIHDLNMFKLTYILALKEKESDMDKLKRKINELTIENTTMKNEMQNIKKENTDLKRLINKLSTEMNKLQTAVSVKVYGYANRDGSPDYDSYDMYGGGEPVIFSNIGSNIGNMYNTKNGRFTAPVSGIYTFSISVWIDAKEADQLWFNYNNARYQTFTTTRGGGGSSMFIGSTNVEIKKGHFVDFRIYSGAKAKGKIISNFHHTWVKWCLICQT